MTGIDTECPECGGQGWIVDHDPECYEMGDCMGCGGVRVGCPHEHHTGEPTVEPGM